MQVGVDNVLMGNWPTTVRAATDWVQEAEEQSLRAFNTPEGVNRRLEAMTALSQIGQARGALMVLRLLLPDSTELDELWLRLNHCHVLMLAGETADQPGRRLRLVN